LELAKASQGVGAEGGVGSTVDAARAVRLRVSGPDRPGRWEVRYDDHRHHKK
jgi:hypothetical protein